MAWPFLAGMIKVVVTYGFEGKPSVNVHFVLQDTPATPVPDATLLVVANVFREKWSDDWVTRAGDDWTVENVTALDYSRDGGNEIQTTGALPLTGVLAVNSVPSSNATVVSQRTDRTGRSFRGRNYIPGLNVSSVTNNELNADLVTDLSTMYTAVRSSLSGLNMSHVVYSLYASGTQRITPEPTTITGTIVNTRVDTQRRRLPATV